MDSDASHGAQVSEVATDDSIRSLIASFLSYLELRLKLLGLEARETGIQFLVLVLLLVSTIIFFAGSVAMLIVFLLYLMMLILHWEWGWSALSLAAVLIVISVVFGLIFRSRLVKPFFPVTFAEFQKDWNTRQKTADNSEVDRS